jgi:hypothetical protein
MSTTVLAYLILFMGFATFLAGAFGALLLLFEEVSKTGRVSFRYYAMMIGLLSGGLGLIGIGQGLRLLLHPWQGVTPSEMKSRSAAVCVRVSCANGDLGLEVRTSS